MVNRNIQKINLQELQSSESKKFSDTALAYIHRESSGARISPETLYTAYFNVIPNTIFFDDIVSKKAQVWLMESCGADIRDVYFTKHQTEKGNTLEYDDVYYFLYDDVLLFVDSGGDRVKLFFRQTPMETVDRIAEALQKSKRPRTTKPEISLVVNTSHGLDTQELEISRRPVDVEHNYNDDFKEVHETITKRLSKKNDKGIVLLHGKPGTGKTTYIRHLITEVKKQIVFLPVEIAPQLTSPAFMELLINNPDSVFVIEDAENIVIDRNLQNGSPVSGLLNLADGLLADCLNIQLICTFNTDLSNVDPALMRKGRLIASYEFGELEVEKAQKLSNKLGFHSKITNPMTLTDIYNQEERNFEPIRKNTGLGFRVA